jgi:hypothetical protein
MAYNDFHTCSVETIISMSDLLTDGIEIMALVAIMTPTALR